MSSISDPFSFAPVMLRWNTVRGTSCKAHWYIPLTLCPKPSDSVTQSNDISSVQTSKIDEPERRNFKGLCKKIWLRILEFFLFLLLYAQVLAKYQSSWRQQDNLDNAKNGKTALKLSLERKTTFLWSFSLSCKVSFLLYFKINLQGFFNYTAINTATVYG